MKERIPSRCTKTKADGTICRANARTGSAFCFFHDPAVAKQRMAARKAGGIERSKKAAVLPSSLPDVPLKSVQDVVALLAATINQVRKGQVDPRISNAVGYLAGILLKGMEQGDTEKRLVELETIINGRRERPGSIFDADLDDAGIFESVGVAS